MAIGFHRMENKGIVIRIKQAGYNLALIVTTSQLAETFLVKNEFEAPDV